MMIIIVVIVLLEAVDEPVALTAERDAGSLSPSPQRKCSPS